MDGVRIIQGTLAEALEGASIAMAYNSNSLTDAVLAGVPVALGDEGAMVWPLRPFGIFEGRERPDPEWSEAREPWAHRLAYCQWRTEEIADGTAMEHVLSAMHGPRWHESLASEKEAA